MERLLAKSSFREEKEKEIKYQRFIPLPDKEYDYKNRPLLEEIPTRKQAAKRHFGCNAYFTRQT